MKPKIISIIPARGGSKGIRNKNTKLLANKPLVAYSIEQSINSNLIFETYISTEDQEIKEISLSYGAKVIDRPKEFAKDDSSTEDVLLHAAEYLRDDFDYMVLLQPTSPLRYTEQINEAIKILIDEKGDSLLSVYENDRFLWDPSGEPRNYDYSNRPRRQDKKWELVENGSIYIFKRELLINKRNRLGGKILFYKMPKWMSFEIDDEYDLEIIRYLISHRYNKPKLDNIIQDIKLIIFDVDGVFTDGSVYLNEEGLEMLKFSRIDGKGIELLHKKGLKTAVITSENSKIVRLRMEKMNINETYLNVKNKINIYEKLKHNYNLNDLSIAFLGDDIQDLEVMNKVGLSCCPTNAQQGIKEIAHYISPFEGGKGFIRDVCNIFLKNRL